MEQHEATTSDRRGLRIGAACLILGSSGFLGFRLIHGDLPTDTGAAALAFVASHPAYSIVHLGDWLSVLLWTCGLVVLSGSLLHRDAWAIGRLGAASALIGASVHIAEFSIDGYALPTLAKTWAAAAPSARSGLEDGARLALVVVGGPSLSALIILWGVTFIFFGIALQQAGYSSWLSWTGGVIGAVLFILGTVQFLRPNSFPGVIFYGLGTIVSQLWTIAVGVAMWYRGRASPAAALPSQSIGVD